MLKNYTPRDTPYVLCYITYYKFAEYNQQDATLHRFLFMWNALHVSDGFSVHHLFFLFAFPTAELVFLKSFYTVT